jgi:hypothetical protein
VTPQLSWDTHCPRNSGSLGSVNKKGKGKRKEKSETK